MTTTDTTAATDPIAVDVAGAAMLFSVGSRHWVELVKTGRAPSPIRLGRRVVWLRSSLETWAAGGCLPRGGAE